MILSVPSVPCVPFPLAIRALEAAGTHFTWHEFNSAHAFLRRKPCDDDQHTAAPSADGDEALNRARENGTV